VKTVGKKIVYSGDTAPCQNILKISKNADLLIHDGTFVEGPKEQNKDYLMKINNRIVYLEDVTKQGYKEVREALERRDSLNKSTKLMVNALTLGSSALGGGVLGYLLMEAGLNPVVMIPSIILPVGLAIYDILKQSIKESKQWDEISKSLSKYKKNMSYDDDAARRFNRIVYERAVKGKI